MKKIFLILYMVSLCFFTNACPVCEKQQPKILQGISHGTGPESRWDMVIIWITAAIVLLTLFFTVKWLIRPGENSATHIKRYILNND